MHRSHRYSHMVVVYYLSPPTCVFCSATITREPILVLKFSNANKKNTGTYGIHLGTGTYLGWNDRLWVVPYLPGLE
jgi:hypothetical protein